jgi:hypothetical protein
VYGFGGGDPVNFGDPFGLCPEKDTGVPCTWRDVLYLNVSFGGQIGVSYSAGPTEGGARLQLGPVGNIRMLLFGDSPAVLTVSDGELSGELYFTIANHGGGGKVDLMKLGNGPVVTKRSAAAQADMGSSRVENHRGSGKSTVSVSAVLGATVEVDWDALAEVVRRNVEEMKRRASKRGDR